MPAKKQGPLLTVAELFGKCQETTGSHTKYARILWELEAADSEGCFEELYRCLSYLLTVPLKSNSNAERALSFISTFTRDAPARDDGSCEEFVASILSALIPLSTAADKVVRVRACSLLASIMRGVGLDLDESILEELQETMLGRLKDKVRMYAVVVLERLPEPGEGGDYAGDPIVKAYRRLLEVERNKDVRKSILGAMPIVAGATIKDLLARTMDVSDVVRKQAFTVLAIKCSVHDIAVGDRALLLRRGLKDRSAVVVAAAKTMAQAWLVEGCQGEVLGLLGALDVKRHPEECGMALQALTQTKNLQLEKIAEDARANKSGLRLPTSSSLLSAEEAFFWRWLCEELHSQGEARGQAAAASRGAAAEQEGAAASDCLQALEAALPESVADLMGLVMSHSQAGAEHGHSVVQLIQIAARCVDLTDASGRQAASTLLTELIKNTSWTKSVENWEDTLLELAEKVHSSPVEVTAWLLDSLQILEVSRMEQDVLRMRRGLEGKSKEEWSRALAVATLVFRRRPAELRVNDPDVLKGVFDDLVYPALDVEEIR